MKKNYYFLLFAFIGLFASILSASGQTTSTGFVIVGGFHIGYPPSSTLELEKGRVSFDWSKDASAVNSTIEFIIECKEPYPAHFENNSLYFTDSGQGARDILLKAPGKFTLKVNVWKNGNKQSRTLQTYEVKATPINYRIDGPPLITDGERTTYTLSSTTNVAKTEWKATDPSIKILYQGLGFVELMATKPGSFYFSASLTLHTGETTGMPKYITVRENSLKNIAITGDSVIYAGQEVKYKVINLPENDVKVLWQTNNEAAVITSGQNTDEVTIKVNDKSNFTLSATVTHEDKTVTRTKSITVHQIEDLFGNIEIDGDDEFTKSSLHIKYKLLNLPNIGEKVKWEIDNTSAFISNLIGFNQEVVFIDIERASSFTLSATIEYLSYKKTISKTISERVSPYTIEGEDQLLSFEQDVKYKITDVPSNTEIKWQLHRGSSFYNHCIVAGQGTTEATIRTNYDLRYKFRVSATFKVNDIEHKIFKDVSYIDFSLTIPESADVGELFTGRLENFEKLKEKYPDVVLGWENRELIFLETTIEGDNLFAIVDINNDLGEVTCKGKTNGLAVLEPYVIIGGTRHNIWLTDNRVTAIGDICVKVFENEEYGLFAVQVFNISDDIDISKTEWLEMDNNETFNISFVDEVWINEKVKGIIALITGAPMVNSTQILIKLHYYDGGAKYIVSPVIHFNTSRSSIAAMQSIQKQTEDEANKTYTVELYSLPHGKLVYREKNVLVLDVNSLNIPSGYYSVRKTDSKGNITTEKIYKSGY